MVVRKLLSILVAATFSLALVVAAPVSARPAPVVYPAVTQVTVSWTPADAAGFCHSVTTATLSVPVTSTTRILAMLTMIAVSPTGAIWTYRPFTVTPSVGTTTITFPKLGHCSSDGAVYVEVGVDLYAGTRVGPQSKPYTGLSARLNEGRGYVCTAS